MNGNSRSAPAARLRVISSRRWAVVMVLSVILTVRSVFGLGTPTLPDQLAANVVGRTNGITDIVSDEHELSGWRYSVYKGADLALLTNAVWSTNFWLRGVQGLSATCIGFSNQMGAQGLFTMVSPRHYLCATHMHMEGQLAAFLDTNNVIRWRRTVQRADVGNDTTVGILDADLPPSVGYLPVLSADYTNYLPATGQALVQGLGMNQDLRIFGEPMNFAFPPMITWNSASTASGGLTTSWNMTIRGGDSSNPAMLLIGDQLVLVSHNYFANGGPNYALQTDAINREMHYLSTNNPAGSDYQLTMFPLTNWPAIRAVH